MIRGRCETFLVVATCNSVVMLRNTLNPVHNPSTFIHSPTHSCIHTIASRMYQNKQVYPCVYHNSIPVCASQQHSTAYTHLTHLRRTTLCPMTNHPGTPISDPLLVPVLARPLYLFFLA